MVWAGWRLHAYVLMGNHYHFLVETPDPTLSRGMRQLNGVYTQYFNRRHRRSGHLFQGRFKGILVEQGAHLTEMIRYIVRNPVRAKQCASAKDWRWSSYRAAAGMTKAPPWLHTAWIWQCFSSRSRAAGQAGFRAHVNGRRGEEYRPWQGLEGQIYLGSESFRKSLAQRIAEHKPGEEIPRAQRSPRPLTLREVVEAVAQAAGLDESLITRRGRSPLRGLAAHLARTCRLPMKPIGEAMNIQTRSVSILAREGARRVGESPALRGIWRKSVKILNETHPEIFGNIPYET